MAIHEGYDKINTITGLNVPWEGKTGIEVEDFISRNLITGGTYDATSEKLSLIKGDESTIDITVSVQTPTYIYGIINYGVRVDGTVYKDQELLMQYREGRKIELGVAIQSVADRSGTQATVQKPFNVTIKFNNASKVVSLYPISHEYFKTEGGNLVLNIPEDTNADDVVVWVDVTEFFKKSFKNKTFETSFKQINSEGTTETFKHVLSTSITNEVINLTYLGDIIINSNSIDLSYEPNSTDKTNYKIRGYIGDQKFELNSGDVTIPNLQPGLNQISAQAVHINNSDIYTDWFSVDVIYTKDIQNTVVAINGVSGGISNNEVATLYEMTVYSPKMDKVELVTYLEDGEVPTPTNIVKQEVLDASVYDVETKSKTISYKKYIEIESSNASKYLYVTVNNKLYNFYTVGTYGDQMYCIPGNFREMKVDAINYDYVYTKTYPTKFNFDQIGGYINNIFVTDDYASNTQPATIKSTIESSDGWYENEGRSYFKVSAQKQSIFNNPLNLELGNNFTIELGVKTYNVSDIDKPILTIGKLQLKPTEVCWEIDRQASDTDATYQSKYLTRVSKFQEGIETHITITLNSNWSMPNDVYYPNFLDKNQTIFDKAVGNVKMNLLRIYINGCIDREIKLEDSEVTLLKNSLLDIHPTTSDVDFYLFRVYNNNSLDFSEIVKNYISFLPKKTGVGSKEEIFNKNDILGDDGQVSWERCQGKINTLLYVIPSGGRFPNRFWGGEDGSAEEDVDKKKHVAMFINYADPSINTQYGGRLNHLRIKGQGSSAMRYLIWNVGAQMKKHKDANDESIPSMFTPMGILYPESIPEEYTATEALKELKNCYYMPPYDGQVDANAKTYKYKKMVGKVNYASSMQSHKIGACKLYDDAYKTMKALPSGGLKAVHEEPYLYFYVETNLSDDEVSNMTWEQVLSLSNQIKFMGFQTWGPGKGDDACSGYDEDLTPEYLMLEGGENGDNSVNFLVPWHDLQRLSKLPGSTTLTYSDLEKHPVINKETSLAEPWSNLLIDDESIVYREKGAWDIDYGCEEVEKNVEQGILTSYFKFADSTHESLKKFREFYDFVYLTDFTFVYCDSTVTRVDPLTWDTNKKYLISASEFYINDVKVDRHEKYDMYRYDPINDTWVRAGLYYNNTLSGDWDRLNILNAFHDKYKFDGGVANQQVFRLFLQNTFKKNIGNYIDTDDISFHQAFIKYLSGTDNRAKNTYFQIIGPVYKWIDEEAGEKELVEAVSDYKIRLIGDDLDTILATDNNGLQSKAYNLIEDSYDDSYKDVWGDLGNIFFRMYDLCFEDDIRSKLKLIMNKAGLNPSAVNNKGTYFYKTFFKVQEDFPAIAYNHTARIYYENADVIKTIGQTAGSNYDFDYKHNNVNPIEQSHGSSLECERQFMKERVAYLAGYALSCLDNTIKTSSGSGGGGVALRLLLEFEPFQDFYPSYDYGTTVGSYKNFGILQTAVDNSGTYNSLQENSISRQYVAHKGTNYTTKLIETTTAINQTLNQVNLFKSLSITGLLLDTLEGNFERATTFEIDNDKILENSDIFGDNWTPLNITNNNANLPVVQNLSLKNMALGDTLDLSTYYKLQTLDLTGSTTKEIIFPKTGNLTSITIPSSVDTFRIYNNPGFTEDGVLFEDASNIKTVYIDCSKCGTFNVSKFCDDLSSNNLQEITLVEMNNVYFTEETLNKLLDVDCVLKGSITVINDYDDLTPKDISFNTKLKLVNKFGNIDTGNHELIVKYTSSQISSDNVSFPIEVSAFYDTAGSEKQTYGGLFGISVSQGNNVMIINEQNPFNSSVTGRLAISYKLNTITGVGINTTTGELTLDKKLDTTKIANVTISVKTTNNVTISNSSSPTKVSFAWKAPQLGDFAYADGTFSSYYNPNKTVIGLVYDKEETNQESGTVYIIGAEYSNTEAHYSGYNTQGANSQANPGTDMCELSNLKTAVEKDIMQNYYPQDISDVQNIGDFDEITLSQADVVMGIDKTGKLDTEKYVLLVNGQLSKIKGKCSKLKISTDTSGSNYIDTTENLNLNCNYLSASSMTFGYPKFNSALLYPYFYSAYLYQPTVKNPEEELHPQYTSGNWYAPSVGELARIIYYRGYSATTSFNSAAFARYPILDNVPNGGSVNSTPIFSLAKARGYVADVWNNIVGSGTNGTVNNIVTFRDKSGTDGDNFSYQTYSDWSNNQYTKWIEGAPSFSQSGFYDQQAKTNAWSYTKRFGIPFTQFNYQKP